MVANVRASKPVAAVSKAAFARERGVSRSAVSNMISRRQLKWPALRHDGRTDVAKARKMLAGAATGAGREGAAARSSTAKDATAIRLARARSALHETEAVDRAFTKAIHAAQSLHVDDATRPVVQQMTDLMAALEGWVETTPNLILAAHDDHAALDHRVQGSFDTMWCRARGGVDDRLEIRIGAGTGMPFRKSVSENRNLKEAALVNHAAAAGDDGIATCRPRAESEVERLGRLRCERAENMARDALDQFHRRLGQYVDARAWQAAVVESFRVIRTQIERELPSLVTVMRGAGDGRRGAIAVRGWLRATRTLIRQQCGGEGAAKSGSAAMG
jgi:hypothetical protein